MIEITDRRIIRQDYIADAVRGRSVLDIGCNAADYSQSLHKQIKATARACVGLDMTPGPGIVQGDAQNFDLGQFEIIVAGEIIEHLADLKGFLSSCARNLIPGGRLIVTTPNPYSLLALRFAALGRQVPNDSEHVLMLDATVACNLIRNFGARFRGQVHFYEESGYLHPAYRFNRWVSKFLPRLSIGILFDLKKF